MRNGLCGLLAALTMALAGCGGGGDSSNDTATSSRTITIAPSLGQVQGASIELTDLQGKKLGQGVIAADGHGVISYAGSSNGLIVEMHGGANAMYFDEGAGTYLPFPEGRKLHAISGTNRSAMTVTAITEVIYQRVMYLAAGGSITPAMVQQAETDIAAVFLLSPAYGSPLDAPTIIGSTSTTLDLGTTPGAYAALLASWARHAHMYGSSLGLGCAGRTNCSPLLDLIDVVARDLSDGLMNGYQGDTAITSVFYSSMTEVMKLALDLSHMPGVTVVSSDLAIEARIGNHYAGTYNLSCTDTDAASSPAQLLILADGSHVAVGTFGMLVLPAGTGGAELQTDGNSTTVLRQMSFDTFSTMTLALPTIPSQITANGLTISLDPSIPISTMQSRAIRFSSAGDGEIAVNQNTWSCSGFPQTSIAMTAIPLPLSNWITSDTYHCERPGNTELVDAVFDGHALAIESNNWNLDAPSALSLSRDDPNVMLFIDSLNHFHSGDDVAATRASLEHLRLSIDALTQVQFRHSMTTGKSYFNVLIDGSLAYEHCQATIPVISTCSGTAAFC